MNEKQPQLPQSLNLAALLGYCAGKKELAVKLLESFQDVGPQYVQEIEAAISGGNCSEVRALCHKARGAASIIHAEALLEVVAKMRQHAIDNEITLAEECLPDLKHELAAIDEIINSSALSRD